MHYKLSPRTKTSARKNCSLVVLSLLSLLCFYCIVSQINSLPLFNYEKECQHIRIDEILSLSLFLFLSCAPSEDRVILPILLALHISNGSTTTRQEYIVRRGSLHCINSCIIDNAYGELLIEKSIVHLFTQKKKMMTEHEKSTSTSQYSFWLYR